MAKITREEVLKLAQMSKLKVWDHEIDGLVNELDAVLTYAEKVNEVALDTTLLTTKNVNVFREDVVNVTNSQPILAQAPVSENNYFVVPKILEND